MSAGTTPETTVPAAERVRPTRGVVALALAIAVLGAVMTWRTVHDERREAPVGRILVAADPLPGGRNSYVMLPSGRLDIRATAALDDVDGDATVRSYQAPDGGSFVGLEVTRTIAAPASGSDTVSTYADGLGYQADRIAFTLVADGRSYELTTGNSNIFGGSGDDPLSAPGRWYVAVEGEPSSLALQVDYEGRSQQVDLRTGERQARDFAPLYANGQTSPPAASRSCGTARIDDGLASEGPAGVCRIGTSALTPHLDGAGWAPAGSTWLLVPAAVRPADGYVVSAGGRDRLRFDALGGTPEIGATLAERPARSVLRRSVTGPVFVFAVPQGTRTGFGALEVSASLRVYGNGEEDYSPLRRFAVTHWTVRI